MDRVLDIFFLPPLAIARLGGSKIPAPSFIWDYDRTIHGAHRTVIRPAVTFEVTADGSLRPHIPEEIRLRDGDLLRPVAPFFELWAQVQRKKDGKVAEVPVTPDLLERLGGSVDSVLYTITVANRKAQKRTGSAACAYIARTTTTAGNFELKPLLAYSPHTADEQPLVFADRPIPLGHFQAIRPQGRTAVKVDLSILRVRFTPARGEVYGPPNAIAAPASPLQPGQELAAATLGGRQHEIVPPENRILNPDTPWSRYTMGMRDQNNPQPSDSYDGANVGGSRSWGVVDDSCDGIIEAQLVLDGQRFIATARILSTCPDFAPDRRPFFALADELADRDSLPDVVKHETVEERLAHAADLFERVIETASMINLDSTRLKFLAENDSYDHVNPRGFPKIDQRSMTKDDVPYVNLIPSTLLETTNSSGSQEHLRYVDAIGAAHRRLADFDTLVDVMRSRPEHIEAIIRPPFGRFWQLKAEPGTTPNKHFRDARVDRDMVHDMRMPPYMRDSDALPLSITWLQYQSLMTLLRELASVPPETVDQVALQYGKVGPRNLTARAAALVSGNPVVTRPEDAVANYFPGLELDGRNLDRRFFPGLVFDFIWYEDEGSDADHYGARLAYVDALEDPDLQSETPAAQKLLDTLTTGNLAAALSSGVWYLDWLEQDGKRIALGGLDGSAIWRIVRSLEPKELTVQLRRRGDLARRRNVRRQLILHGWRRRYTDPQTGVISGAYQPGELMQGLCSPWQHDFRDCACFYWASNHPDLVYGEIVQGEPILPGGMAIDPGRANTRLDWLRADRSRALAASARRSIAENRPFQFDHHEINRTWQKLSIVLGNTEMGESYIPPKDDEVQPFESRRELIDRLRNRAAPLEMALAIEYLYAMFSIISPDEAEALSSKTGRWPTLAADVAFVRHRLKLVAISEMQHLRWANQLLWELHEQQPLGKFRPVLQQARTIPTSRGGPPRPHRLQPMTFTVLDEYVAVEKPSGRIDGEYARIVATLRQKELGYSGQMAQLAERIVSDGMHHESHFLQMRSILQAYVEAGEPAIFLRKMNLAKPGNPKVKSALRKFREIVDDLRDAYSLSAEQDHVKASVFVHKARKAMDDLLVIGEALARQGIGIPFPVLKK